MTYVCLIFFVLVVTLWFFFNEFTTLIGLYMPAYAVKQRILKLIVVSVFAAAVALSGNADVYDTVLNRFSPGTMDPKSLIMIVMSTLIILLSMRMFSIKGSVVYSAAGALWSYGYINGSLNGLTMAVGWIAAPLMSFILSLLVSWCAKTIINKRNIHLIVLAYYMRFAVIAAIIITVFAVGLNFGGFVMAVSDFSRYGTFTFPSMAILLTGIMAVSIPFVHAESSIVSGKFADFTIYTVLTTGLSVSVTVLFFTFDFTSGLFGMSPVPVSVCSVLLSAVLGAEIVRKNVMLESDEYVKEGVAMIAAPVGSALLSYILLSLTRTGGEALLDYTVMTLAVIAMLSMVFVKYIRDQKRLRDATDRLVYSQQQQIYENSRALNDMELKVVISENQALHNSIEMKKQEVMNVALSIVEQREYLESLSAIVNKLSRSADDKERSELIAELNASLKQRLSYDRDVDSQYFYAQAESLHEDFNAKMSENFPNLTQQERRLATLLRLGFSSKYIATLMNITPKSVEISRYRLRQKLGLEKGDNLVNFIKSI